MEDLVIDEIYKTSSYCGRRSGKRVLMLFDKYRHYKGYECRVELNPSNNDFVLFLNKGEKHLRFPIFWQNIYRFEEEDVKSIIEEAIKHFEQS